MRQFFTSVPGLTSALGLLALIVTSLTAPSGSGVTTSTGEIVQIAISFIVLGAALYIILSKKYPDDTQKWAFGIIGLIVGYWLPIK